MNRQTQVTGRSWFILSRLLAVLLGATALLKIQAAAAGETSFYLADPRQQLALGLTEFLIGAWLLLGVYRLTAWLVTLVFFLSALVVSGWSVLNGVTHCPCFGTLHVSPKLMLAFDLVIVACLLAIRPSAISLGASVKEACKNTIAILIAVCTFAPFVVTTLFADTPLVAALRGDRLRVAPYVLRLGTGNVGEKYVAKVRIRNDNPHQVTILGGTSDCQCMTTENLPAEISGFSEIEVPVHIRFPGRGGCFARRYVFYTSESSQPYLVGHLTGCARLPAGNDGFP